MREDSATALLDDFRRWLDDPPSLLRRPIATRSRGRIKYADTGAELRAFTSRSQTGVRSFQPVAALVSEAAFAPDLAEVVAQADAAVGEGLVDRSEPRRSLVEARSGGARERLAPPDDVVA
jgi:hypothetical protein